jgi:hypothetical protein
MNAKEFTSAVGAAHLDPGAIAAKKTPMKYLCLVYGEEKKIGAMTDDECLVCQDLKRLYG